MFETEGRLTDRLASPDALLALFSPRETVQRMLDVEAALARALGAAGVIPYTAVEPIEHACRAELLDAEALTQAAARAGNIAIPLVKQLTARVAQRDPEAAKYVHWGATSQDIIDTSLVLQLRDAFDWFDEHLASVADTLAAQAERHRATPMIGRTWLQQALPITLGLKFAQWLDALDRHRIRFAQLRAHALVLQFGGAAGTLASLGEHAQAVAQALSDELALPLPLVPWHTQRDRLVEVATTLGLLTGTLGKIARDVSLQMQSEIGELAEPSGAGKGGSSTMPHKRNPVGCAAVLSAATRMPGLVSTMLAAMVQEHERALGGWQAEWETLPDIVRLAGGAVAQIGEIAQGMEIDRDRLSANLDLTRGLVLAEAVMLALGESMGRLEAHRLVEAASREALQSGRTLREVLAGRPEVTQRLDTSRLDALFDPAQYAGLALPFVDAVLDAHRASLVTQESP
ncbi:3-carboxy-cis,cis-muconate cycloisomerase [Trinickia caryophylli]|uniref:3-carboxy-cis,cis-muconate cycloisomerase n=1 Tax=Trinickia caryophylli TaxID=28094 RepID=A0A1X7CL52_TRICW|nr:3-carboxy-cis,cis-muconate cycloisomerase [Trinickia caryophylli]PMS09075.1 3-carboxy-cis,cis-muconate cycloisomerase [Trinickia caryophylli]TRX20025.1 3-carboxy-cis,cis-muconate cycloisomerase [Trinickia caryophylli]WQE12627.1 3-carboxy-cis,cis-muconate cycloisomerase [Trinickia caryophylli]SME98680.1 3-carboxy-cis,cis-muconate cycloisomerase [Trinickia caryophylli]GLU30330.1 3-carboxy-cis,cis-muconate cycloisomerase [Trinickia caryophylli]